MYNNHAARLVKFKVKSLKTVRLVYKHRVSLFKL